MSLVTSLSSAANAEEILGEVRALSETLGDPGVVKMAKGQRVLVPKSITSVLQWRRFVDDDFRPLLTSHEWPLIVRAFDFASHGYVRELVALDQECARLRRSLPAHWQSLDEASCRVGRRQMERLRGLRDQRLVQRYLSALESGEACGWHTLAYGVVLALFALPLRQGLAHYARQTTTGFLTGMPLAAKLSALQQSELVDGVLISLQPALQKLLPAPELKVV